MVAGERRRRPPAAQLPVEPAPLRMLDRDGTRTRRPRWVQDPDSGRWRLGTPWMTSPTDSDLHRPAHDRVILGLTPGRSSAAVVTWLNACALAWLDRNVTGQNASLTTSKRAEPFLSSRSSVQPA